MRTLMAVIGMIAMLIGIAHIPTAGLIYFFDPALAGKVFLIGIITGLAGSFLTVAGGVVPIIKRGL